MTASPIATPTVTFAGRVLFLTDDAAALRRQLAGEDLAWSPVLALRHDISTDEITPAYTMYQFDRRLGEQVYVGLRVGGEAVVTPHAVRAGGFAVSVSGRRRGIGSSREHSPQAERHAGIRLLIAESFERIYLENAHNLGLYTSTDFGLIDRIRRGEAIPLAELSRDHDPVTRAIIERGGLFRYNAARIAGLVSPPAVAAGAPAPRTLGEKILGRHRVGGDGSTPARAGEGGFFRADLRVCHEYITPMAAALFEEQAGSDARVHDPASVVLFRDHLTFLDEALTPQRKALGLLDAARELATTQERFARAHGLRLHGEQRDRRGSEAINHNKVLEAYACPGDFVVSADSHAPHAGAIGCIAIGVGSTAMANAWLTGDVRAVVPESVRIAARGRWRPGVVAKDLMLEILRHPFIRAGGAAGRIVEYDGEAIGALAIEERATLTNMAAELGAFSGIVRPDDVTVDFLVRRRGMPEADARARCEGVFADPGARYAASLELDVGALGPMLGLPGDPGRGLALDALAGDVAIDIAYGGSCTASKTTDMDMYAEVFRAALARGLRVHPDVTCIIQFGSVAVREHSEREGHVAVFEAVGARLLEPGCGACCNAGPGVSTRAEQVTVSSINRNFPGRSGPGSVYLASPYTVAASAITGVISAFAPGWDPAPRPPRPA